MEPVGINQKKKLGFLSPQQRLSNTSQSKNMTPLARDKPTNELSKFNCVSGPIMPISLINKQKYSKTFHDNFVSPSLASVLKSAIIEISK